MKNILIKSKYFIWPFMLGLLASCANVKQIDRGQLAAKFMQLDPTPHESSFMDEVHTFREGAAGGTGRAVGGGCGCN